MDENWTKEDAQRWHDVCTKQPEELSAEELSAMKTLAERAFRLISNKFTDGNPLIPNKPEN
jgi:hypothetical protein